MSPISYEKTHHNGRTGDDYHADHYCVQRLYRSASLGNEHGERRDATRAQGGGQTEKERRHHAVGEEGIQHTRPEVAADH